VNGSHSPAPRSSATRRGWTLCCDAVVVAVIALIVFQGLRRFVGDYYRVPSGSMQPFLHGHAQSGDVVFVDAWSSAADCRRGDVVVVRHPDDSKSQLVKRIAARGDDEDACCINIHNGDVWLGGDKQQLAREVKEPAAARKMRAQWASWPGNVESVLPLELTAGDDSSGELVVPPLSLDAAGVRSSCRRREGPRQRDGTPIPPGFVGCKNAVDATYLTVEGRRGREGEDVQVFDAGIDLQLGGAVDALIAVLETRSETITFHWLPAQGRLELWRDGEDVEDWELPVLPAGGHRIEFGRLDDQLFFIVDGRDDVTTRFARLPEWKPVITSLPRGPRTRLFVAALGGEGLVVESLRVFRDVYHFRNPSLGVPGQPSKWPIHVEPGHWFLLGDNAFDSRDSRQFKNGGSVPADSYIGRPRFVLGPWPRNRWLHP